MLPQRGWFSGAVISAIWKYVSYLYVLRNKHLPFSLEKGRGGYTPYRTIPWSTWPQIGQPEKILY